MKCKVIPDKHKLIKQFGYFDNAQLIGKCAMKEYSKGQLAGSYLLHNVAIDENYRGKGLSTKFLKSVLKHYRRKQIYLSVLISNIPALKCYTNVGFVEIKRGKKLIFMRKD
jgi:RimJ/RimL family protein N-acetyltransferase